MTFRRKKLCKTVQKKRNEDNRAQGKKKVRKVQKYVTINLV